VIDCLSRYTKKDMSKKQTKNNLPTVLLKMSGEVLSGEAKTGFNKKAIDFIAEEIYSVHSLCNLVLIIGGGNLIRGAQLQNEVGLADAAVAHYGGMLATVINAITFQEVLERKYGLETRVMSALEVRSVAESYIRRKALRHLEKHRVVLLAGGTGNPGVSTDTAMVLRAQDLHASIVLKGTKVDGIYDRDPKKFLKEARLLSRVSYLEFLNKNLRVIDTTAVALAQEFGLSISVFNIFKKGNLKKVLAGESIGSTIGS
jgi:uridylate kinase